MVRYGHGFTRANLTATISSFTAQFGGKPEHILANPQLKYLCRFLTDRKCAGFVIEDRYIDRDYMDDHCAFYARCHRGYPNHCQRIHFFRKLLTDDVARDVIHEKATNKGLERQPKRELLDEDYLGFIVVRPNPRAFVGRTVFRPWLDQEPQETALPDPDGRQYRCIRPYPVNLAGINLSVKGIAFQQQDQVVSACATTAIWVALQKTAYDIRFRVPTPSEITAGATRFSVDSGRPIPNAGLYIGQMCEAIRAHGLEPDLFPVPPDPFRFRRTCHAYLQSGFPVVISLYPYDTKKYEAAWKAQEQLSPGESHCPEDALTDEGHAVTLVGFRSAKVTPAPPPVLFPDPSQGPKAVFVNGDDLTELYAHDDRLGPYSRISCLRPPWGTCDISIKSDDTGQVEYSRVTHMLVPVYPKIRLPYYRIETATTEFLDVFTDLIPQVPASAYRLDFRFVEGTAYREELVSGLYRQIPFGPVSPKDLSRIESVLNAGSIPKYIAVCRVTLGPTEVMDVLIDTTESVVGNSLYAIVCREPGLADLAGSLSNQTGFNFQPRSP